MSCGNIFYASRFSEFIAHVGVPAVILDIQDAVRAERGQDFGRAGAIFFDFLMPFEVGHRVIRGADNLHIGALDNPLGPHVRSFEPFIAGFPDFLGVLPIENQIAVKITLQLQMRPMV